MPKPLPLFPLEMVLFPSCRVPLHIFEERYKLMISECVDADSEFGIVWGSDEDYCDVGCAARVIDVVDQFPDSKMNIIIQGTERFRALERSDEKPYISSTVETLPDLEEQVDKNLADQATQLYSQALKFTLGWFQPSEAEPVDIGALSYNVAASLGLPLERQQNILETRDANARLKDVLAILEEAMGGLQDAHRKTTGNGKV